jgi:hypothetical protein
VSGNDAQVARPMTKQADFTPDDWETLRLAPMMVAMAMRFAAPSGPGGRFLEDRAAKHAARAALARLGSVALIADLARAGLDEASPPADADAGAGSEAYIAGALAEARRAHVILTSAAGADEAEAYASLVLDIAEAVARAAGEPGSDVNVTEGERTLLVHLAEALGADGYEPPHRTDSPFGDYRDTGAATRDFYGGEDPTP